MQNWDLQKAPVRKSRKRLSTFNLNPYEMETLGCNDFIKDHKGAYRGFKLFLVLVRHTSESKHSPSHHKRALGLGMRAPESRSRTLWVSAGDWSPPKMFITPATNNHSSFPKELLKTHLLKSPLSPLLEAVPSPLPIILPFIFPP